MYNVKVVRLLCTVCIFLLQCSGITTIDASWLPVFVRGECHNLKPVMETDASKVPRYDESLGTVVHHVTCSFGLFLVAVFIFMSLLAYDDLTYML